MAHTFPPGQLIVSRSGCCGMCIEHSVAEGIVYINMTEAVIRFADGSWVGREKEEQKEQENEVNGQQWTFLFI